MAEAARGDVQLFVWNLDDSPGGDVQSLSADEQQRADRFRFDRDRTRYVNGRSMLRAICAEVLGVSPASVSFEYGDQQKPELAARHGALRPHFNLAHSEHVAVLALHDHPIGIDVEVDRDGFAEDHIAERFFAPAEVKALRSLPIAEQRAAFFRCWTRKEAYLKALGGGLSIPLDEFTVTFARASETPRLTWVRDQHDEPDAWTLRDCSALVRSNPIGAGATVAIATRSLVTDVTISLR